MNRKRYGREKYKQWRNGKGGRWNARISWFHNRDENQEATNIRLRFENANGEWNVYPASKAEADKLWDAFKDAHKQGKPENEHWQFGSVPDVSTLPAKEDDGRGIPST